jgi:hypothetical protein
MDNQAYLDQISTPTSLKKTKNSNGSFLKQIFIALGIAVGLFALIAIFGGIISANRISEKDSAIALKLRSDNIQTVITDYNTSIKSSDLRSTNTSLSGILSDVSSTLETYITSTLSVKQKEYTKKVVDKETSALEELKNELFEAKINGLLDRTFARKMIYETQNLINYENTLKKATRNESLKSYLSSSANSLMVLHDTFSDFSENN